MQGRVSSTPDCQPSPAPLRRTALASTGGTTCALPQSAIPHGQDRQEDCEASDCEGIFHFSCRVFRWLLACTRKAEPLSSAFDVAATAAPSRVTYSTFACYELRQSSVLAAACRRHLSHRAQPARFPVLGCSMKGPCIFLLRNLFVTLRLTCALAFFCSILLVYSPLTFVSSGVDVLRYVLTCLLVFTGVDVLLVYSVGYGGAGAFPDDHIGLLQGRGRDHHGV